MLTIIPLLITQKIHWATGPGRTGCFALAQYRRQSPRRTAGRYYLRTSQVLAGLCRFDQSIRSIAIPWLVSVGGSVPPGFSWRCSRHGTGLELTEWSAPARSQGQCAGHLEASRCPYLHSHDGMAMWTWCVCFPSFLGFAIPIPEVIQCYHFSPSLVHWTGSPVTFLAVFLLLAFWYVQVPYQFTFVAPNQKAAMCMFLTPGGIKTLFPIFENSLVYKELAEKTQWPLGNQK